MAKAAVVQSSAVVEDVALVTPMMVAHVEDLPKLWRRVPTVVELVSH
jgi:hypothetical protein